MRTGLNRIKQKVERKNKRSIFTFLVFLLISTAAWFLIKLSENYVTQATFRLQIEGVPADKWIPSEEQSVMVSLNIDGFHTLRSKMMRDQKRCITIPLNEVPYRLENGNTYSFSSQYVARKVADKLSITPSDVTMSDAKIYFTMDSLKSTDVPVAFKYNIKPARQYGFYDMPVIEPSMVRIYGPQEIIDTIRTVRTTQLNLDNVSQSINETVPLDMLGGRIRSDIAEVNVKIQVEKYTEKDVEVPIRLDDSLKVRFFPETISVKCLVALRDYASITPEQFSIEVDRQQMENRQPLLNVRLGSVPPNVQIIYSHPDKVEYLISQ